MTPLPSIIAAQARTGHHTERNNPPVATTDGAFAEVVDTPDDDVAELVAAEPALRDLTKSPVGATDADSNSKTKILDTQGQSGKHTVELSQDKPPAPSDDTKKPAVATVAQTVVEGRLPSGTGNTPLQTLNTVDAAFALSASGRERSRGADAHPAKEQIAGKATEMAPVADEQKRPSLSHEFRAGRGSGFSADKDVDHLGPRGEQSPQTRTAATTINAFVSTHHSTASALTMPAAVTDLLKQPLNSAVPEAELLTGLAANDRAVGAASQTATGAPTTAGAEAGRQVAQQIAVAITNQHGRATEIALNPEELGRVRLRMTVHDTSIMLSVLAERPETIDLLRRHIDALAQEFRALGYDNITFSFGDDGPAQDDARDGPSHRPTESTELTDTPMKTATQPVTGLDLRL